MALPAVSLHFWNVQNRLVRGASLSETRDFLSELLALPDASLLRLFGVSNCPPQAVHSTKDAIFAGVVGELARNGWNCNAAAFGPGRRDTFLMEMARRGLSKAMDMLLGLGADANYTTHGYGDSTPLMSARDPEIMGKLLARGANPMEVNAQNQTDFTCKLLSGLTNGALFYAQRAPQIPLQPLLNNFRECILDREVVPYNPMYPLCVVPVPPPGSIYKSIIDQALIDAMFSKQFLPFTSLALAFNLDSGLTVWRYIRARMQNAPHVYPTLLTAYLACMSKSRGLQTPEDFACVDACLEKAPPNNPSAPGVISRSLFIHMLFSLGALPRGDLIRWLLLLGKFAQRTAIWMDLFGEAPFHVTSATRPSDGQRGRTHLVHELGILQSFLTLRISAPNDFGEFVIPKASSHRPAGSQ